MKRLDGHAGRVNSCKFLAGQSVESGYVCSGGQDLVVRLWNAHAGKVVHQFTGGHSLGDILEVAFAPGGSKLASVGFDKGYCACSSSPSL